MRAAQLVTLKQPLSVGESPDPSPPNGWQVVSIYSAALNRRDYWMQQGLYPKIALPVIPGSDGAGLSEGNEVLIDPGLFWGSSERVQSAQFRILGMPDNGTLAEKIAIPADNIYPKPAHLTWDEAAALPLAGVTAYRALFVHGSAMRHEQVLITGIGGGVALTAMQMALAAGLQVWVTSGDQDKIRRAKAMGAAGGISYGADGWQGRLLEEANVFDLIIDSAGGTDFSEMLRLVKPGGRIVVYGGTAGKIQGLSPQILFWRQISIIGSTMGSPADFRNMLEFVSTHRIVPVIDSVYPLDQVNAAFSRIQDGAQFGKVVVRVKI